MKAKDITVGQSYFMKVSGTVVPVRVNSISDGTKYSVYACTNLKTGRPCSARSASKFRGPVPDMYKGDAREIALQHGRDLTPTEGKQHADPTAAPPAGAKPTATTGAPTAVPSPTITTDKPTCQLSGSDGNVFAIIGNVSKTLKRAGQEAKADEFRAKAMASESYDAVLQLCFDYVDVE